MGKHDKSLLQLDNISKSFSGVLVLDNVNLNLYDGEVLALMGENGAGKSTLMNILSGNLSKDSGKISINGEAEDIHSARKASELGIAIIHQELNVVPTMTVAENLALGNEPLKWGLLVDKKKIRDDAIRKLKVVNANINPDSLLGNLGTGEQQIVEIAKAIAENARILILDEPTASLSRGESENLFSLVNTLREQGTGLIYISHRMEEVWRLADRITVLRDGQTVLTSEIEKVNQSEVVAKMVGRKVENLYEHSIRNSGDEVLEVRNLKLQETSKPVSFSLHSGEVVGMSGLVGAGRTEIARAVIGADRHAAGMIKLRGKEMTFRSPKEAIHHGVGYLPENRKTQSIFPVRSVEDNISVSSLDHFEKFLFLQKHKIRAAVLNSMKLVNILQRLVHTPIINLSGGNQQKAVFARWMMRDSDVLILDEPTRGVDVGAKQEIYELINSQANKGKAILVISSDLPEVIGISDRILVVRQNEIVASIRQKDASEENIMGYATGIMRPQTNAVINNRVNDTNVEYQ